MAIVANKGIIGSIVDMPRAKSATRVARKSFAITPSDTVNFAAVPREIECGGAGTVRVVNMDDTTTDYTVIAGSTIPQSAKRINATGTTATGLVGVL